MQLSLVCTNQVDCTELRPGRNKAPIFRQPGSTNLNAAGAKGGPERPRRTISFQGFQLPTFYGRIYIIPPRISKNFCATKDVENYTRPRGEKRLIRIGPATNSLFVLIRNVCGRLRRNRTDINDCGYFHPSAILSREY